MDWFISHLIGDYLLQNDWLAVKKKKSLIFSGIHAILYCIPFMLLCQLSIWTILSIFVQHWLQDYSTLVNYLCFITGKFQTSEGRYWGHIIIDNVLHIVFIYIIITYCDPIFIVNHI